MSPLLDSIRARGWMVAVHNDYRLDGKAHTFWLFTKDGRCVKGEGLSDKEALELVDAQIREAEGPTPSLQIIDEATWTDLVVEANTALQAHSGEAVGASLAPLQNEAEADIVAMLQHLRNEWNAPNDIHKGARQVLQLAAHLIRTGAYKGAASKLAGR